MHWLIDRRLLKKVAWSMGLCFLLLTYELQAQNDCETTLNRATDEFNAGHFYGLSATLKPCIDSKNFTREQLVRAYQLLTQTYLILDDPLGAESSYLNLLRANPEFISSPDRDPIDVVYLSKKFTATPIFSWFAQAGGSVTSPSVIRDHNTFEGSKQEYTLSPGFTFGGGLIWNISDRITAEAGANFTNYSFKYTESGIYTYDNLGMTETQSSIMVPLSLKYTYILPRISPYGYVGVSANLLLSANQKIVLENVTPTFSGSEIVSTAVQTTELDMNVKFRRDKLNRAFHIGAGARYKYKLNYFFADVRYSIGLNNIVVNNSLVKEGEDNKTSLGIFNVGYVDDYFRLNQFTLTIGYINPWYKPRKLNHARTKSTLRTIKKQRNEEN